MKSATETAIGAASKAAFHGGLREAGFRRQLRRGWQTPRGLMAAPHLVHAMLAKEKGLDDEAAQQLRYALNKAGESSFRETVLRIAERLQLTLE